MAKGKLKKKIKKVTSKAKSTVKKVVSKGKSIVQKGVSFIALKPLEPVMKVMLKSRGIKHGNSLEQISLAFYNHVIKGDAFETSKVANPQKFSANFVPPDPATVSMIVQAIISFFKMIKEKKAKKEALSKEEEAAAEIFEEVESEIKKGIEAEDGETDNTMLYIGIAIAIVVVIAVVKKGK